jgi:hypothetical protein
MTEREDIERVVGPTERKRDVVEVGALLAVGNNAGELSDAELIAVSEHLAEDPEHAEAFLRDSGLSDHAVRAPGRLMRELARRLQERNQFRDQVDVLTQRIEEKLLIGAGGHVVRLAAIAPESVIEFSFEDPEYAGIYLAVHNVDGMDEARAIVAGFLQHLAAGRVRLALEDPE